jgi:hypothetical protein
MGSSGRRRSRVDALGLPFVGITAIDTVVAIVVFFLLAAFFLFFALFATVGHSFSLPVIG